MAEDIVFYNSWSKQKEQFKPRQAGMARIYNCGPTVYKRPHIGNLRRFIFADMMRRTLESSGYKVKEITNITDVGHLTQDELEAGEDKMEKEARREKVSVQAIADREIKNFKDDLKALNIQPASRYPRATEHIPEMVELIETLIEKGYAYQTEVGVFFAVDKFKPYGKLSGNTVAKLSEGARLAVRREKKQPADFALWLTDDPQHLQQWDSPWGRGYPGWHIECSAMSRKYLGSQIDIHTGGVDNKFPHHENEIAQSEAATGEKFVNFWMHNAHLQVGGQKLAKSGGQQITLDTIKEKEFSPLAFRWLVLSSHYRSTIDFSWDKMAEAKSSLDKIKTLLRRVLATDRRAAADTKGDAPVIKKFKRALADDLNSPSAIAIMMEYVGDVNRQLDRDETVVNQKQVMATLRAMDRVLGVISGLQEEIKLEVMPAEIRELGRRREEARRQRDFEAADQLKEQIIEAGYAVEDTKGGYRLFKK